MRYDYHVIIIGAGSAGLTVASGAAGLGARTALIEKGLMGGDCLNYGCVPSKTFLKAAHLAKNIQEAESFGIRAAYRPPDLKEIMTRVKEIVSEIAPHDSRERFEKMGVDVYRENAELLDKHTLQLSDRKITGKNLVIATGSEPRIPEITGLDEIDYLTNKNIFDLEKLPEHLIILGGGPIGLELGQGFRHLGSKVTIIDHGKKLFPKDDPEVWPVMREVLEDDGIDLYLETEVTSLSRNGAMISAQLSRKGTIQNLKGDVLLISAGRIPQSGGLNLEQIGVKIDRRGYIITDRRMRTSVRNIWAAGDVTGPFQFTHMAGYQAVKIIPNMILHIPQKVNYALVPWTTYTRPEVAHVGYTEPWAREKNLFSSKLITDFNDNDRSKAENNRKGFLKLILGRKNRIIGATIVGEKAGEMIPAVSLAISRKLKANAFTGIILSYPTEAEILQKASMDFMRASFKNWMKKLIRILFL